MASSLFIAFKIALLIPMYFSTARLGWPAEPGISTSAAAHQFCGSAVRRPS